MRATGVRVRGALLLAALLALAAPAQPADNVTVIRRQFAMEELHTIEVDPNTEYIMDFTPTQEQSQWPARVWLSSSGGDVARPLLVTHRQRAGAGTWQLPAWSDGRLLFEFERTLCPDDSVPDVSTDCEQEQAPGGFSLHALSACAARRLQLRAEPARDWRLRPTHTDDAADAAPLLTHITLERPRVHYYMFEEGEEQIRIVISSEDDVCATIAIQNYTCPIAESLAGAEGAAARMTVMRSGAVQLSRSRFPRGFYVVSVVHATDAACSGESEGGDSDWLWDAAVLGRDAQHATRARRKTLTIETRSALSRAQYAVAGAATLALFLSFYVAFALLALAQRWPPCARHVRPRAVLKDAAPTPTNAESGIQSQTDGTSTFADTPRHRRRASDATFDSSDNSDSEESDEEAAAAGVAAPRDVTAGVAAPRDVIADMSAPRDVSPSERNGVDVRNGGGRASEVDGIAVLSVPDLAVADSVGGDASRAGVNGSQAGAAAAAAAVGAAAGAAAAAGPYGLPARLRVAALARRKARVLRARSDRYLTTLATVAIFYALPVVQFVIAFQIVMNVSGSLDLCYYNFLCAHPAGQLSDFNHVFSNLGYLLLGALFMLQLRRRRRARDRLPRHEEYGIPAHYGLLASLGAGMMVVALLSASYHVCPNRLNFQFDVAFMYVLAVLSMVKIYQSRHPDVNARAHATFAVLAVVIAIVVWGVLGGGALFWGLFTVLHVFTFLLLSLRIYYIGQFRLEKQSLQWAAQQLRAVPEHGFRPLYTARLVLLLIANAVNWAFALYGLFTQSADFASHLLFVLLGNALVYMVFYLSMKLLHGERPRWYAWCYLAGAAAAWAPALYYFTTGSSSWASTPAASRHRNHECRVLQFYDAHDLWHMLSAIALYLTFNVMLTWDDGLAAVPRSEIAVF